MKTVKLSDIRKKNAQRRDKAIQAVRKVDPDFLPGLRDFDRPRKNPHKKRILKEMQERENELQRK